MADAALELLAVERADEIDDHDVAGLAGALLFDLLRALVLLGDPRQGLVDLGVGDIDLHPLELHLGEIRRLDLRQHLDGERVFEPGLLGEGLDLDLGLQRRAQAALRDRLVGRIGDRPFQHLAHHRRAVALLEERHRHLAGAEARQTHRLPDLLQPRVHLRLDVGGRHDDLEFALEALFVGLGDLHLSAVL